jgi:hypothetical protein
MTPRHHRTLEGAIHRELKSQPDSAPAAMSAYTSVARACTVACSSQPGIHSLARAYKSRASTVARDEAYDSVRHTYDSVPHTNHANDSVRHTRATPAYRVVLSGDGRGGHVLLVGLGPGPRRGRPVTVQHVLVTRRIPLHMHRLRVSIMMIMTTMMMQGPCKWSAGKALMCWCCTPRGRSRTTFPHQ